jgi:hypothetical protein
VVVAFIHEPVVSDDVFTVFLFVVATHPAVRINPIAINKAYATISFIEGSATGRMILIE